MYCLPPETLGTVYFMKDKASDKIKIGFTTRSVDKRKSEIESARQVKLEVLRTEFSQAADERWLHSHFSDHHIKGDWFNFTNEMLIFDFKREFLKTRFGYYASSICHSLLPEKDWNVRIYA